MKKKLYKIFAVITLSLTGLLLLICTLIINEVKADVLSPETDARYCGYVARTSTGRIKRSSAILTKFRRIHPCPVTGSVIGSCVGWNIDHTIPLACGGCDSIVNLQWLPIQIKRCSKDFCKDRFERKVVYYTGYVPGLNPKGCTPKIVIIEDEL